MPQATSNKKYCRMDFLVSLVESPLCRLASDRVRMRGKSADLSRKVCYFISPLAAYAHRPGRPGEAFWKTQDHSPRHHPQAWPTRRVGCATALPLAAGPCCHQHRRRAWMQFALLWRKSVREDCHPADSTRVPDCQAQLHRWTAPFVSNPLPRRPAYSFPVRTGVQRTASAERPFRLRVLRRGSDKPRRSR